MQAVPGRVLVTGATGFVGTAALRRLVQAGWQVVAGVRQGEVTMPAGVIVRVLGDLNDYTEALDLSGVDAVVHLAAAVHDPDITEQQYLLENRDATAALGRAAIRCGVGRFVFVSSIKVNGEGTQRHRPVRDDDPPRPEDAYARSKAEAEEALWDLADGQHLDVTVLRPPLVYGPGVRANFASLLKVARSPLPLPTGLDENRRSLLSVDNLASAIVCVLADERARGRTYLLRDGVDMSTAQIVRKARRSMGRRVPALPVPRAAVAFGLRGGGWQDVSDRLLGDLTVDDTPLRDELGWRPVQTVEQGIETALGMPARPHRLLFLVTEDWYFASHRLPVARAAVAAGWEVHVACRLSAHEQELRDAGLIVHPLYLERGGRQAGQEVRALRQIQQVIRRVRPDVLHNVALKPVLYGSWAAARESVPVTVNAMAGLGSVLTGEAGTGLRSGVVALMRWLLGGPRQWMIVQNPDDAQFVQQSRLVAPGRLRLVPGSGVDVDEFAFQAPPGGRRRIRATVVSRMLWDKGIAETVQAARILADAGVPVDVDLVGDSDPQNPRSISARQLQRWNDQGIVRWHGRRQDIAQVWAASDIAVLASYREGMPKSLLEAASIGRPMVACDVPGCRQLVRDGGNGLLVPARDAQALAAALARLAADQDLRERMGKQARQAVEAEYSLVSVVQAQLALYDAACGTVTGGLTRDLRP